MSERSGLEIAIIGMAGRFPKAADLEQFWRNLRAGEEGVSFFTDEELAAAGVPAALIAHPDYVKAGAIVDGIELFDAEFFGISAREAEILDPQHRLLLECAWEALEKAGYVGTRRPVGVFAGASQNSYVYNHLLPNADLLASQGRMAVFLANEKDFLASRVSYKLGLEGPSVAVQTACSTSLTAVHLACQSLLAGECELALAGGVSIGTPQKSGQLYQPDGIMSPDGHCRSFDAAARGTVSGQGFGLVVLRLLEDALDAGDHIHAVIKGSASNNDGSRRVGFTAPSRDGQARVIAAAQMRAEVEADSISYVEAHGSATPVGDPIEVAALTRAFRETTDRRGFCALGSVKSGIGHLDAAAGVAGLIKTVLALENREIPPSLHFESPNPEIDFASSPFYVATRPTPWAANGKPRRAGVSSFGLGGTNVHVILEEAPPLPPSGPSRAGQVLILSARSAQSLEKATDNLAAWLDGRPGAILADVAHTLQVGRIPFPHRRALVAAGAAEASAALRSRDPRRVWTAEAGAGERPVAFLLPGVGDHYPGMAEGLYRTERVFREELDRCAELLRPHLGLDLREALFAGTEEATGQGLDLRALLGRGGQAPKPHPLHETHIAQPAVMAVSWALAQLWLSWGVRPQALLGYSLGEYTAACLAGVMPLEEGLALVAHRARLIAGLPPGAMLAVPLSEADLLPRLTPGLSLAAENGPGVSVVAGTLDAVDALERQLTAEGLPCRRLPTTHALHSVMMEPIREALAERVAGLRLAPPSIPSLSNLTGTWITAGQATDPLYWADHLCRTVRFGRALETLWAQPQRVLLEVGPGQGLSTLALQHPAQRGGVALASLRHAQDRQPDDLFLLDALARLWLAGVPVDWEGFAAGETRRRMPLPTYPFERRRYWIDPPQRNGRPAEHRQTPPPAEEERTPEAMPAPALPARHERPPLPNPYVPPATPEQQQLAALWQELLGVAPVGLYDNFFALGGHSLLGTQMMARLRAAFGVDLPLSTLFESPTIADLVHTVREPVKVAARPPLRPRPPGLSELPLSFGQQRLWFLHQMDPASPMYNMPFAFRLAGPFAAAAMATALTEVVRRHETLRTTLVLAGDGPVQSVAPAAPQPLPLIDLSALPEEMRESTAVGIGLEESRRPFDLSSPPVVRTLLLHLAERDHVLLFTIHHVSGDDWSVEVLSREIVELYGAAVEGRPAQLPELPIQYADFALWQRSWLQGEVLAAQIEYWRRLLGGAPALLEMPLDRPRPPVQSFRGGRLWAQVPAELASSLAALGQREGATGFMTLLAGFQALLHRYSGQESVVVGTPIANRQEAELEHLIGFFANTLALRADFVGDPGFAKLLAQTREMALGAYAHQDLPFERLVDELTPQRDMSYAPVFQVLFAYQNAPRQEAGLRDLTLRPFGADEGVARFDLTLLCSESPLGLSLVFDYNAALFEEATASRMLRLFSHLLAQVNAQPGRPIRELALLDEEERRQVVLACNTTARPRAGEELSLHGLFARQAALTPEAPAVVGDDGVVRYEELAGWAGRIAERLEQLGIGPEDRVGVCLERSAAALAAMLGTLRAGAAYVPLDPEWPRERLASVAADAGLTALLTRSGLAAGAGLAPCEVLVEEAQHGAPVDLPWARPASPEAAAYVIYTSGSTGMAKGVMTPHRAAANFVLALGETLELTPADRLLLFAPLSFDASVLQIFPALSRGAAVVVHPNPRELAGAELPGFCERHGVTVLDLPAALWRQWIEDMATEGRTLPAGIRTFLTGGESVPAERVRAWAGMTRRPATFLSSYGPTEATVTSTVFVTDSNAAASLPAGKVPIGRPLPNVRTYVLDAWMQPVPAGVAGELYLAGDGLARGYLGRPELTAAAFLPDAQSGTRGGRLYRTGDLARRLPGGDLEFLGRADTQVKIRGFRLELSEVETVLGGHPDLAECVVTVREDRAEDRRLVAYVVPQPGREPGVPELRSFVAERLPQHMVPSTVVVLSALPVLASGKVDRAALPAPEHQRAEETWLAPRTPVEEVIAGIWVELLGLERAGASDHFFDLGGHSLLATQVMSRLRGAFNVEMPLRDLFEASTLADLAVRVEAALRDGAGLPTPPLVSRASLREGESLPLSFAQQRLWFIDQLQPGSPLYNIPVALRVEGPLRAQVLALCLAEITRRHEGLRTVFRAAEGSPVQVIQPAEPFRLAVMDLSGLPEREREALALTLAGEEANRPFDLGRGPLLRGMLLRLADEDHIAVLTMHHIVSDGWSMGILVREVTALYPALAEGRPSPLAELPLQYADFAAWQASWLHGETLEGEIAFWRRQLAGLPPLLELPTDRPRPAAQSFRGALRPVRLPAELTRQAQAMSQREGATLFMVLLAGLQALLARYSGQQDLAVGTPVAGRNRIETEGLIGFFINTLVLRGDLTGAPSFRELLARVRETALDAHTHQDVPFEKLVQELSPERSFAHTPLFQVVLALQNAPVGTLEIPDLRLRPVSYPATTAKFDLTLNLEEQGGRLSGAVEYATDLFDAATIDRLILQYERLLTAALAEPERRIGELPLLPAAERHQLLAEWNDTAMARGEEDADTLIHEPFEAWARRTPEAVALVWRGETISYGDLEERADFLARRLVSLGAGPGRYVGIHLRRGPGLIVAVLAVLKAGAIYVPLEIGHPPARLRQIVDTLEIAFLITETAQRDNLPAVPHAICLDEPEPAGAEGALLRASPDDLAYVIFTSGSTGTPKGVMVRHRPVINLLRWAYRTFAFSPEDRVLFVTALSFDLSVFDIFGLLGAGGSIRIADEEEIRDPERLLRALAEEPITFWDSAPAALEQTVPFLAGLDPEARPALRLVFLSGDWIPVTLPGRIRERFPGARVIALGGATEATVWSNVFPVERVEPSWTSIPYGRPIENARYHVLDAQFAPCPVGVPGDLYIGGDCLADGYANEPVLTAHKFLPDPWSNTPGARLYRTGDRARYRPDGNLEFLGRLDHQVKIRGFRIELGEIETALASLPGVREAVVMVRDDRSEAGPGGRRLVAYVAGDVSGTTTEELRRSLRERLPDYMVPAAFVKLAALPLTSNGKVDRKALPAPEQQVSEESHEETWLAPRTPVEEVLTAIWAELLGLERVGADAHFFDLGGHSLLVTQVLSRLREAFAVEMSLRDLFEAPVLADLAARVEAARWAGTDRLVPPLAAVAPALRKGPLPLSFAQQRLWFIDQLEPGTSLYNIPMALRIEGPLAPAVLALCLGEIERRHEALRTVFAMQEGAPVQVIRPAAPFELPLVDLSGLPEPPRESLLLSLAEEEARRPFDLARGPLLRGVLLRLAEEEHAVALTVHHIASDGWSMGILVQEVMALYGAFAAGSPSPLPELPVQYADFAAWQQSWLCGDILEEEISFWRRQLAGLPPLLALPTDRPRPAVQSFRGASRPVRLPVELAREVQALVRREGATLFMTLLAGFQALLARYSGQQELAVGSPVAGRNRLEIEGLIGFFTNTLVLHGDFSGEPSFRELLGRVRETALAAYLHQDLPFEKLVEELAPERSLAHAPVFQVMLVLQNNPTVSLEMRDLRLRPVSVEATTAKFDLMLSLAEQGGTLDGGLEYATDLFDAATVDRLIGHFERLLAAAVAEPGEPVSALPLANEAERFQILVEWNDRGPVPKRGAFLHELFEAQLRRTPEAVAVLCGDAELTYAELGVRAGRLARRLRRLGVGPDVPVGLLAERSLDMVTGVLGILQAGGTCVPFEPSHPAQRLAFLLDDTRAPVLLTQAHLRDRLPAEGAEILLLDGEGDSDNGAGIAGAGELAGENLAYVIYTSGSTGRPKGVALSHGVLRNLMDWHLTTLLGGVRTLQFALLTFDVSFYEIFACWGSGGTLVVVPDEMRRDMPALADLLVEQRIEKAILPVVVLQQLAEIFAGRRDLPPLLEITTTGERLQTNRAMEALFRRLPGCAFHNHYGPSETHVATAFTLPTDPQDWPAYPPIGQPIWRCSTYVLTPGLVPAPLGVPGDLYIGGACLARGYLRRPDLTAERFVPDPFGGAPGLRLYRTGDKVRLLANGDLEYLGRFDHQVKIRGFRVEPGEIEALLLAMPEVREAAVLVRDDRPEEGPGTPRLVAYVAGDVSPEGAGTLRAALREQLPEYMVPSAIVTLPALPLTPNGKVDRKALPAPEQQTSEESWLAPRTAVEEILAGLWAELLGLQRVGATDHFFDLGGHSLLATQVRSKVREAFGVELPLRTLFEQPVLADLAAEIEALRSAGGAPRRMPIQRADRRGSLPLSYSQQRLWFLQQLNLETTAFNLTNAVRLSGPLDGAALEASFGEIVRRHSVLRTRIVAVEGVPHQIIDPPGSFTLFRVDLSGLDTSVRNGELPRVAESAAQRPFDLAGEPPLRVVLVRLTDRDHAVLFSLHHTAGDGWSLDIILIRELGELYTAYVEGRPSPLSELPFQYADWAAAQQEWLRGPGAAEQLAYWRRKLGRDLPTLTLPMQRQRPPVRRFLGSAEPLILGTPLSAALADLARSTGSTLFMCLLAAFKALLHLVTGAEDLLVGTHVANREWPGTEGLIGLFVNDLALRTDVSGRPSFRELLARVRETALEAYAHQDLPFEALQADLRPNRSAGPLFQVLFVLQNAPVRGREMPGLSMGSFPAGRQTANFDLTLRLYEGANGIDGAFVYDVDLFEESTIARLAGHFVALLREVVSDPDRPLSSFSFASPATAREMADSFSEDL
ncbi:MAG TPA: amino acid adenylation domain-containing protein [Thermoanaerobaculia bacterium]|nr:amino acid adenylation domain-containing protein [Thermoanaerobaculia bacterium]